MRDWLKRVGSVVAALGLALGAAGRAEAGLTTYSSRSAFLAAAGGGLALADFEGLGFQTFQTLDSSVSPAIPPGVQFSSVFGSSIDLFVAPAGFNGNPAIATDSLFADFFGTPLIANFSPAVTAVGADVIPFDFSGNTTTIAVAVNDPNSGTSTFFVTPPLGASQFFGVIATGGSTINQVVYSPPGGFTVGVDNFLFGQAAGVAVPEPASLTLLGLGLAGMGGAALRRRKK